MWYERAANDQDVVLSSRVSIVRNIKGYHFPKKMHGMAKDEVMKKLISDLPSEEFDCKEITELSNQEYERAYNEYFVNASMKNGGVALCRSKEDDTLAIIINNTDHFEVLDYQPGSDIVKAFNTANDKCLFLESKNDILYMNNLGFLTSSIGTVGSGIQIMITISIPALEQSSDMLPKLCAMISKYNWNVLPIYVRPGEREPGVYAIVNEATMGVSEKDLIVMVNELVKLVVEAERACRATMYKKMRLDVEDKYGRALGVFKYAKRIGRAEALNHLRWLRIGHNYVDVKPGSELNWELINKLNHKIRRDVSSSSVGGSAVEDSKRATLIREMLGGVNI